MTKQILLCFIIITALMVLGLINYLDSINTEGTHLILGFKKNRTEANASNENVHLPQNKNDFFGLFPSPAKIIDDFPKEIEKEAEINDTEVKSLKKILYWNDWFGNKFFGVGFGREPFLIGGCQYDNCFTTALRDRFQPSEVDAVIWHLRSKDRSLPKKSTFPNARFIFFTREAAIYSFTNVEGYNNVFDTTFTYRGNSDIPYPYNVISRRNVPDEALADKDFSAGRTRIAAWLSSNCRAVSDRQVLVGTLMKYSEVDVYGECGEYQCPKQMADECFKMIAKNYFFYLAFENSLCKDYITEKFFDPMRYDIVPVVYGYGPYWKHAPPHSYIDVFDFTSVEELAKYLVHLSQTPYEYNEYFRWKTQYFVLPSSTARAFSICRLCEILNTQSSFNTSKYDLQDWFMQQSDCQVGQSFLINDFIRGKQLNESYNQFRCSDGSIKCRFSPNRT